MGGPNSGRRPNLNKSSPEERMERQVAKVTHLFAHPRLETVPDPEIPLGPQASLKYRELTEMLLKAGQLTSITKSFAESGAIAFGEIHKRQLADKSVSADLLKRYQSALISIQQLDVDAQTPGATEQKKNKFRNAGFSSRHR